MFKEAWNFYKWREERLASQRGHTTCHMQGWGAVEGKIRNFDLSH